MLSLLISLIISIIISSVCISSGVKSGSIAYGILGFILSQVLISLLIRKRIKTVNEELQNVLAAGQKRITHKVHQFQSKPGGNPKLLQQQIERDQHALFRTALEFTDKLDAFRKWNLLMGKQIATMRLQFLYQLKEFKQVDQIFALNFLKGPVLAEPLLVAMKMARQFQNNNAKGAEKTFKRYIKWFRGDRGELLYGVMSWIHMKQNDTEAARLLLGKAKEKMYNEVIVRNWEMLSNNKEKSFSNAGFGDQWYSLFLEKPPAPKQQRVRAKAKGRRPF